MGTGELYAVVEWIPAAMWVQFAPWIFSLVRLLRIVRFRRESVVFPGRILISLGFSDLPTGLGLQHLCVTADSGFFYES